MPPLVKEKMEIIYFLLSVRTKSSWRAVTINFRERSNQTTVVLYRKVCDVLYLF